MQKRRQKICVCREKAVILLTKTMTTTKTMQTILIVDDEQDIREILSFNLEQAGYHCITLPSPVAEISPLQEEKSGEINLILLDVMMPGMSGFEWAQMIRCNLVSGIPCDTPVIFLTALGEEDDMLHGFQLGADDYISKPFSIREVLARIEAVLRRKHTQPNHPSGGGIPTLEEGDEGGLYLDDHTFTASIDGEDIGLTKMEYELLHFLIQHPGAVYSRGELLTEVWPDNGLVLDRTVDVTITRLRKKIGIYKDQLKTKTGYGYYWEK